MNSRYRQVQRTKNNHELSYSRLCLPLKLYTEAYEMHQRITIFRISIFLQTSNYYFNQTPIMSQSQLLRWRPCVRATSRKSC